MSFWTTAINTVGSLLSQGQAAKLESSSQAAALKIAELNQQSKNNTNEMLAKILPIVSGTIAIITIVMLTRKK